MSESVENPTLPVWYPTMTPQGTLFIPLSSGEWELVLEPDGTLGLICNVPNMQTGIPARHAIYLGDVDHHPIELVEAINLARNAGSSCKGPT